WRGAQALKLREQANRADPKQFSRLPNPITPLRSRAGPREASWSIWADPEQLAAQQRRWEAAERLATEAENQLSQATDDLQRLLYGTPPQSADALPAYEQLPDGSLSPIPHHRWFGDAAAYMFATGKTESGRPILVSAVAACSNSAAASIKDENDC